MGREKQPTFQDVADAVAPGWERRRPEIEAMATPVRERMLHELAARPGETVLELAAGIGETGFTAAAALGDDGRLISTDFSPAMVEGARRRATALGLRNVEHRVMDAQRIELEGASVDGVLCRFGYMLMPDPAAALAETRRVLRPGGRVALAVWGPPQRNPWLAILFGMLVESGHAPPPEPGAPTPFSLGDEARLGALLEDAGFRGVRITEVPVRHVHRDVDDYLGHTADLTGPTALVLRGLAESERERVATALARAFAPFAGTEGYALPGLALVAAASAPDA